MRKWKILLRLLTVCGLMMGVAGWSAQFNVTAPASVTEGNDFSVTTNMTFTITLSGTCSRNTTYNVTVGVSGGTAMPGFDYTAVTPQTLSITSPNNNSGSCGSTSQTFSIPVKGDIAPELDETVIVSLSNPTNGATVGGAATGTIANDDTSAFQSGNHRVFSKAAGFNENGNLQMIGNSVLLKTGGVCPASSERNNVIDTVYADVDPLSGNTTFNNSTTANLTLPAGTGADDILWAGLYWQGYLYGRSDASKELAKKISFRTPGMGLYTELTSESGKFNWVYLEDKNSGKDRFYYQGVAEVTSMVKTGLDGTYGVANLVTDIGMYDGGQYGAWSLVVIYKDDSDSFKNLVVYDGYLGVSGVAADLGWNGVYNGATIPVSGFLTPTTGDFNATFAVFGGEGDNGYESGHSGSKGDFVSLSNSTGDVQLVNALNPIDDIFNATISKNGVAVTARNPQCSNTIGIDLDTFDIGSSGQDIMQNRQTSTTIKLGSAGEAYFPGVFAFATDLYQPRVCYYEEVYQGTTLLQNGAMVNKGDIIDVVVRVKNAQIETAQNVLVSRIFDTVLPYIEDSTKIDTVSKTDAFGDDQVDYNLTSSEFKVRLGTGADASVGGNLLQNQTTVFEFQATVNNEQNSSFSYDVYYTNENTGEEYPGKLEKCVDFNNTFWGYYAMPPIGVADFIDTSITTAALSNVYNASADTSSSEGNNPDSTGIKYIKTKIAGTTVPLTAVYLNDEGLNADYNNGGKDIDKAMWFAIPVLNDLDVTGECPAADSAQLRRIIDPVTNDQVIFTIKDTGSANYSTTKQVIIPENASKNAKIEMIVVDTSKLNTAAQNCVQVSSTTGNLEGLGQCVNSAIQYVGAFGQAAYNRCTVSNTYGQPCLSQNHGEGTGLFDTPLGCFMCTFYAGTSCSSDDFAIRPNDFNSTVTPNQQFVAGQPVSLTFRADKFGGTGTLSYNETEHSSFVVDVNISDATKTCAQPSIHFSPDVGFVNGIAAANYTLGNVGDFNVTMHETIGSEYALVDADDTNDTLRLITPFKQSITVIPDHFALVGSLTNGSNGFTYLSNFENYPNTADRNISALLDFNITARGADDMATSNYTGDCYAKDGNITMNLTNALAITPAGALSKMIWYDRHHDVNGSISPLAGTVYEMPFFAAQFDSTDANGTADMNYLLNFDRNETRVVDPFSMQINSLNAEDSMSVNGNLVLNNDVTFVYGRLVPRDTRVFGNAVNAIAPAWHELYNAATALATPLPPSRNESKWFINTLHDGLADGNGVVTQRQTGGALSVTIPAINGASAQGVNAYNFGHLSIGGYKAHIDTDPWLWYGTNALGYTDPVTGNSVSDCLTHPCFNITVVPAIAATGSARQESEGTKGSKNSDQGTGWKSTTDYAPAVR